MKTSSKISWITLFMLAGTFMSVSCGNTQKKQTPTPPPATQNQQADSTNVIVEESEVVVVSDSITPDSTTKSTKPTK